jgi:hypothetical protein
MSKRSLYKGLLLSIIHRFFGVLHRLICVEKGSGKTLVFPGEESSETLATVGSQNKYHLNTPVSKIFIG